MEPSGDLTEKESRIKSGLSRRWPPGMVKEIWVLYLAIKKGEKKEWTDLHPYLYETRYADILRERDLIRFLEDQVTGPRKFIKLIAVPE